MTGPDTSRALLRTEGLGVRFGGHVAVNDVSCTFRAGEVTAIIGPNGAGKTTYFNLISGQIRPSAGRVWLDGRDVTRLPPSARTRRGIGRAFQLTNLFPGLSLLENVRLALQARRGGGFGMLSRADGDWELLDRAERLLQKVRLLATADLPVTALPHGDQRKLEVAMLLALDPVVYMFDEPTAGMSAEEAPHVLELIAGLRGQKDRTVLLVEHKLDVIRALADRIIVLHNGTLVADGGPEEVMRSAIVQEAYMGQDVAHV